MDSIIFPPNLLAKVEEFNAKHALFFANIYYADGLRSNGEAPSKEPKKPESVMVDVVFDCDMAINLGFVCKWDTPPDEIERILEEKLYALEKIVLQHEAEKVQIERARRWQAAEEKLKKRKAKRGCGVM